ncbi:MAG: hypothetical protein P8179_12125 [Candidatus Thiodiazotropha sp.]
MMLNIGRIFAAFIIIIISGLVVADERLIIKAGDEVNKILPIGVCYQ